MTQCIVYEIDCKICQRAGLEVKYYGETARTSFDRGIEHLNALDKQNKESPLVEHQEEDHPNVPPEFEMRVKSIHPRPLQRQTEEAFLIDSFKGHKILNRKGEWGPNLPPKLGLQDEEKYAPGKRKSEVTTKEPKTVHGSQTEPKTVQKSQKEPKTV